jgi:hypothetical protein
MGALVNAEGKHQHNNLKHDKKSFLVHVLSAYRSRRVSVAR